MVDDLRHARTERQADQDTLRGGRGQWSGSALAYAIHPRLLPRKQTRHPCARICRARLIVVVAVRCACARRGFGHCDHQLSLGDAALNLRDLVRVKLESHLQVLRAAARFGSSLGFLGHENSPMMRILRETVWMAVINVNALRPALWISVAQFDFQTPGSGAAKRTNAATGPPSRPLVGAVRFASAATNLTTGSAAGISVMFIVQSSS